MATRHFLVISSSYFSLFFICNTPYFHVSPWTGRATSLRSKDASQARNENKAIGIMESGRKGRLPLLKSHPPPKICGAGSEPAPQTLIVSGIRSRHERLLTKKQPTDFHRWAVFVETQLSPVYHLR